MASLDLRADSLAVHVGTGVKRAWRGRGVATALKATQIAWAKEAGYSRLETSNDTRNESILRLNESFGYTERPSVLTLRGPLAPSQVAGGDRALSGTDYGKPRGAPGHRLVSRLPPRRATKAVTGATNGRDACPIR